MPSQSKIKKRSAKVLNKLKKLNLGCGQGAYKDFINVDIVDYDGVDLNFNIMAMDWPLEANKFDEVWLIHTLEYLSKKNHPTIFSEINRVLKIGGKFVIAYPEFSKVARNWLKNAKGQRDCWEKTIFGHQKTLYDYHVCAVDTKEVIDLLFKCSFSGIRHGEESVNTFNTIVECVKNRDMDCKESILAKEVCTV